jgi:hypothetical protein
MAAAEASAAREAWASGDLPTVQILVDGVDDAAGDSPGEGVAAEDAIASWMNLYDSGLKKSIEQAEKEAAITTPIETASAANTAAAPRAHRGAPCPTSLL